MLISLLFSVGDPVINVEALIQSKKVEKKITTCNKFGPFAIDQVSKEMQTAKAEKFYWTDKLQKYNDRLLPSHFGITHVV